MITDSNSEMCDENINVRSIKSWVSDYDNIDVVFAVPEIESEIIQICKLEDVMPELSKWNPAFPKEAVRKKAFEIMKNESFVPVMTKFYKSITEILKGEAKPKHLFDKTNV